MPYGERRLYGVCCAEKGTFRFRVARPRPRRPRLGARRSPTTRCSSCCPRSSGSARGRAGYDVVEEPRAFLEAIGEDPADPEGAVERMRAIEPRLAALLEPTLGATFAPTLISAGREDQRDPGARRVRRRLPAAAGPRTATSPSAARAS